MAKAFSFELQGLKQTLAKYKNIPKQIEKEISAELQDGVNRMVQGAKRDAPGDQGILRAEISSLKIADLTFEYISSANYSGYVEFGTKSKVDIPAGLQSYAAQVKAQPNTSSLTAKEAIYAWCKRKGIEPKAWYSIYRSIMVNGMRPHPFFFKQVQLQEQSIINNIKNVLSSLD